MALCCIPRCFIAALLFTQSCVFAVPVSVDTTEKHPGLKWMECKNCTHLFADVRPANTTNGTDVPTMIGGNKVIGSYFANLPAYFSLDDAESILLSLEPERIRIKVDRASIHKEDGADVWVGQVSDDTHDVVTLTMNGSSFWGTAVLNVNGDARRFELTTEKASNEQVHIIETDLPDFTPDTVMLRSAPIEKDGNVDNFAPDFRSFDSESDIVNGYQIIDVMVVYTKAAAIASGEETLRQRIRYGVALMTEALHNSRIPATMNLVYMGMVDYQEPGSVLQSLYHVTDRDGKLDEIFELRDRYGADLVQVVTNDITRPGACEGLGWYAAGGVDPDGAFSVLDESCLGGTAMAHEMGHNFGLDHDRANSVSENRPNYGYRQCKYNGFSTIMAYSCGRVLKDGKVYRVPAINRFSDPLTEYNGMALGNSGSEDNSWVLWKNYKIIAGFRKHISNPEVRSSPTTNSVSRRSIRRLRRG
eukprot:comp21756_c0_seq1/m.30831 comp21756_c0_seq1/g.30831  ORF comp21756_c0_seq1/g.30831 comp21756_c0_seq1/m.30831 type:complete len:474 (-) comp21756_c0_seq1:655-2076(-)